jgi:hypothetical protein
VSPFFFKITWISDIFSLPSNQYKTFNVTKMEAIKVYEVKTKKWYESIKLASEYFEISSSKIKDRLDAGEWDEGGKKYDFRTQYHSPYFDLIEKHNLKYIIGGHFLSPKGDVWLWSRKKQTWFPWKVTVFPDGKRVFKYYERWIRVDEEMKRLF